MRATIVAPVLVGLVSIGMARAEPVQVSLLNYAFDFPAYGYEITVTGKTRRTTEPIAAGDRIRIREGGYTLRSFINRLGRSDRRDFVVFYNEHCFIRPGGVSCEITATGEVELDDDLQMVLRIQKATLSKGGNSLTVGTP